MPNRLGVSEYIVNLDFFLFCVFQGYVRIGDNVIICLEYGFWSEQPLCQPMECYTPNDIDNGQVEIKGLTFTNQVSIVYLDFLIGSKLMNDSRR